MALTPEDKTYIEGLMVKARDFQSFSHLIVDVRKEISAVGNEMKEEMKEMKGEMKEIKEVIKNTPIVNKAFFAFIGIIVVSVITGFFSIVWNKVGMIFK